MTEITFDGMEEVLARLEDLIDPERLDQALGKACAVVERAAKRKAPKGTGGLRRSIASTIEDDEDGRVGIVYSPLLYAPYVEYGTGLFAENGGGRQDVPWRYQDEKGEWHTTSGMSPQPFMRPALNENKNKIRKVIKEALIK